MKNLIKKALTLSLILTLAVGTFVSCSSSDDNNDGGGSLSARVVGTYVGPFESTVFKGTVEVIVAVAGDSQVLITFASSTGLEPFTVKLTDSGVHGIIQSSIDPICQFMTQTNQTKITGISKLFTFSGDKK